ncbi:MAG: hypothetical protein K0R73_1464 [Candidatus Midichloriaceae bacterium]|nr:hypothetical protein [Candidatus Midichloriaceae bacterium]
MADKHKVHNWSEYNTNLINRGNIYFLFAQERDRPIKYSW